MMCIRFQSYRQDLEGAVGTTCARGIVWATDSVMEKGKRQSWNSEDFGFPVFRPIARMTGELVPCGPRKHNEDLTCRSSRVKPE